MKRITFLFSIVFIVLLYVFGISLLAYADFTLEIGDNISKTFGGEETKLGFTDKVDVTVRRERLLGTKVERIGQDTITSTFYFFDTMPIPLESKGIKFFWFHIGFVIFILVLFTTVPIDERGSDISWDSTEESEDY